MSPRLPRPPRCARVGCVEQGTVFLEMSDDEQCAHRPIYLCRHDHERVTVHGVHPTIHGEEVILPEE